MPLTKEETDLASAVGHELAAEIIPSFQGMPLPVLFNTIGGLFEAVFFGMRSQGYSPAEVLEEYDALVAYTRGRLECEMKRSLS